MRNLNDLSINELRAIVRRLQEFAYQDEFADGSAWTPHKEIDGADLTDEVNDAMRVAGIWPSEEGETEDPIAPDGLQAAIDEARAASNALAAAVKRHGKYKSTDGLAEVTRHESAIETLASLILAGGESR